jgi:RNA recognition motif-containing protein
MQQRVKLHVGYFAHGVTEGQLRPLFEKLGTVHSLEIARDEDSVAAYAFVELDEDIALLAMDELDGTRQFGSRIRVSPTKKGRWV